MWNLEKKIEKIKVQSITNKRFKNDNDAKFNNENII